MQKLADLTDLDISTCDVRWRGTVNWINAAVQLTTCQRIIMAVVHRRTAWLTLRHATVSCTQTQMQPLKTTYWSNVTHNNGHHTTTGKGIPVHTCSRETWRTCVCSAKFHDSLSLELCISPAPWHHALSERHNNMPLSAKHLNYSHWIYTTQYVASEQLQARYPVTLLHVA